MPSHLLHQPISEHDLPQDHTTTNFPAGKSLNEQLRLLDDAFVPTMTPTNTWLSAMTDNATTAFPTLDISDV
jgi:hypothetical protein